MTPFGQALLALLFPLLATTSNVNETWELLPPVPWAPRTARNVVMYDGKVILVGGDDGERIATADVWSSLDGGSWTRVGGGNASFLPRLGGASSSDETRLLLMGGVIFYEPSNVSDPPNASFLNDVWRSNDGGASWELVLPVAPWAPRAGHACVNFLSAFYLLGGVLPSAAGFSNDVWRTADGGLTWVRAINTTKMWAPRAYAAVAVNSDLVWIAGGADASGAFADLWSTASFESWTAYPATAWPARDSASLVSFQGLLWLLGGRIHSDAADQTRESSSATAAVRFVLQRESPLTQPSAPSVAAADVWRTTGPHTGVWLSVELTAVFGARSSFGALAVQNGSSDSKILVLGGAADGKLLADSWVSTANLLCEDSGVVCSGHGTCMPLEQDRRLVEAVLQHRNAKQRAIERGSVSSDFIAFEPLDLPPPYTGPAFRAYYDKYPWMAQYREASASGASLRGGTFDAEGECGLWCQCAEFRWTGRSTWQEQAAEEKLLTSMRWMCGLARASAASNWLDEPSCAAKDTTGNRLSSFDEVFSTQDFARPFSSEFQTAVERALTTCSSLNPTQRLLPVVHEHVLRLPQGLPSCTCNPGFVDTRCSTKSCNSATCVHGNCAQTGNGSDSCVCSDPSRYAGPSCNTPVCSRSCGSHGVCTGPSQCTCAAGWASSLCNVRASTLFIVGQWVRANVEPLYASVTATAGVLVIGLVALHLSSKDHHSQSSQQQRVKSGEKVTKTGGADSAATSLLSNVPQRDGHALPAALRSYGSNAVTRGAASAHTGSDSLSSTQLQAPKTAAVDSGISETQKTSGIIRSVGPLLGPARASGSGRGLAAGLLSQSQPTLAAKRVRFAAPMSD